MAAAAIDEMHFPNKPLTQSQQKRLEKYQSLGSSSKTRADKRNVAQITSTSNLKDLSEFGQFCETLCSADGKALNPSNFLDWVVVLISLYTGTDQTISIQKWSANKHSDDKPLSIHNIDSLIPVMGPRDRIMYQRPDFLAIHRIRRQNQDDAKHEASDLGDDQDIVPSMESDTPKVPPPDIELCGMTTSYAFAALPDQRLLADDKCRPYVLDDTFRWTIVHGTGVRPPPIQDRRAGHQKIRAAAVISDGEGHTYCVYGTKQGLFYNAQDEYGYTVKEPIRLLNAAERVNGIFRQNDYLFVLTAGPKLYNVTLTENGETIAVNLVFRTRLKTTLFGVFNSFIGGYYDPKTERLVLGSSNAMIYVFNNNKGLDNRFDSKFKRFRATKMEENVLRNAKSRRTEQGSLMFVDVDNEQAVYIGNKYVMKVSLDSNVGRSQFASVEDISRWIDFGYDCHHLMYIYHQRTMLALHKLSASATRPFVLRIHTEKTLRFE